jgi:hypothetical protein
MSFATTALSLLDPGHVSLQQRSGQGQLCVLLCPDYLSLLGLLQAKEVLAFVLGETELGDLPNGVPQCWDAYPAYGSSAPALGSYRFDFYAAYSFAYVYAAVCNDTAFLTAPLASPPRASGTSSRGSSSSGGVVTGMDVLLALATSWQGFPPSTVSQWLRDYGPDKRDYLEVVPTYVDVVGGEWGGAQ